MNRINNKKQIILKYKNIFYPISKIYNYLFAFNYYNINNKNKLILDLAILRKTKFRVNGYGNIIKIGDLSRLKNCSIYINGNNNVIDISDSVYLNQVELHIEDDNNEISIGSRTSICGKTQLAAIESTKITIGEDCLFSNDIYFRTGDSHSIIDLSGNRINKSKNIYIGNHVWIGTKVLCLKGVEVAENCIVGAGSILNKKYEESNAIIVGNPGKIVKNNINWLNQRI